MSGYTLLSSTSPGTWRANTGKALRYRILGVVIALVLLIFTLRQFQSNYPGRYNLIDNQVGEEVVPESPQKRRNVAVASTFGYHFDVYMAVVWTLQRVMKEGKVQVYTPGPFYFDFQRIVDTYKLYNGTYKDYNTLVDDVTSVGGDGGIDLIVLGTCELDMRHWSEKLLAAWDARDSAHKFQIVCIVHDVRDEAWQPTIQEWSRRNAIRLLPISQHVGNTFLRKFEDLARSTDVAIKSAGYEYIPVDAHIPILDLQGLPERTSTNRPFSNAVIQGSFSTDRRDYTRIFADLNHSLHVEPESWGYLPLGDGPSFVQDTSIDQIPFKLHLVGSGWIDVPIELKQLVVFHTNLNYTEYYQLMSGMDACIPAFLAADDKNFKYQASSSIVMCLETNVPILAVRELRESYIYIDDDRVTINRPAVMSEFQAIKVLRTGDASDFLESDPSSSGVTLGFHSRIRQAVHRFVNEGWVRTKEDFDLRKKLILKENERIVLKILQDRV
ncbi:hypothetical protein JR316_0008536 [Psilocybe cubensis]|uniref:Uncharacterized protein n=2 Tax=Psilocybe cubensis TaxID=181762 RepID=A0A8H8CEF1_PSICU|nr:hypothetical protein JR316_0008536 [Psilocybe cubensis]KAH9479939.1 hypothetical protein JR316_0008536 [Psilocybe cubensis]